VGRALNLFRRLIGVSLAIGLLAGMLTPRAGSFAQTPSQQPAAGDLQSQYDAAFQEMLNQPANLDVLFKFASLATQTGDLEGAVSALERMLVINPDLPRVRLELGVLYYRLGSYAVADTYLTTALASKDLPPDVRSRAEQFAALIKKRDNPSQFSGEFFLGLRYQSNANLGPTGNVLLFGQLANLNQAATGTSDWGAVASAVVRHTYDLGRQDKSAIETQFTFYSNRQFNLSAANITLLDLASGPRFQIFQGTFEDVTLKPFFAGGYIWVKDTPYYGSYGAGLELSALLTDRLRNVSTLTWRQQNYPDTSYLPTNSLYTGTVLSATTSFLYQLTGSMALYALGNVQRDQTQQAPWLNYGLFSIGGGLKFQFADPLFKSQLPWSLNLSFFEQWWQYDAPDPTIDPVNVRHQTDSILNLVFAVPLDARTIFSITGGRFNRASNIPNYIFTNNSAMFGVSWRF